MIFRKHTKSMNKRKNKLYFNNNKNFCASKNHQNCRKQLKNIRFIKDWVECTKNFGNSTAHYTSWRAWADNSPLKICTSLAHQKILSRGPGWQAWSWHSYGGKRGPTSVCCPLTSTCMLWHTPTSPEANKCLKNSIIISHTSLSEKPVYTH